MQAQKAQQAEQFAQQMMLKHGVFPNTMPLQQQAQSALATAPLLGIGGPPPQPAQGSTPQQGPGATLPGAPGAPVTNNFAPQGQ
jgi:hypothetical protein